MCKCKIQWIDSNGNPTPDDNDAVAMATCYDPRTFGSAGSDSFPICAKHAEQALTLEYWKLSPLPNVIESIKKSFPNESDNIINNMIFHIRDNFWSFVRYGMFIGVEQDGYIHS
jgi:hypothetical protein